MTVVPLHPAVTDDLVSNACAWALSELADGTDPTLVLGFLRQDAVRQKSVAAIKSIDAEPERWLAAIDRLQPEADETWPVALLRGARDPKITTMEATWPRIVKAMSEPRKVEGGKLDAPGWMPVQLKHDAEPMRKLINISAVWALVCDLDDGQPIAEVEATIEAAGLRAVMHTTWSHHPDGHKARVIFPFDVYCPARRWPKIWAAASKWALERGMVVDARCKDASRLYFLPALPADDWPRRRSWFVSRSFEGDMLSWREVLIQHPPAEDPPPRRRVTATSGLSGAGLDREGRRRKAFAEGLVRHRCRQIVSQGEGGRNTRAYAAARAASQLAQWDVLDLSWAASEIHRAAVDAGLSSKEAARAVDNGLRRGQEDGPWQWS